MNNLNIKNIQLIKSQSYIVKFMCEVWENLKPRRLKYRRPDKIEITVKKILEALVDFIL